MKIEMINTVARQILDGHRPTREQIMDMVRASDQDPHELLYWAGRVRRQNFGNTVRLCSIVAGKFGNCSEDCKWCAQSSRMAQPGSRPRLADQAEVISAARQAIEQRATYIGIVNSGRGPTQRDLQHVLEAGAHVVDGCGKDIKLCASLGELTVDQARRLADIGTVRYHHNLETSRRFYPQMVTTHSYDDRLNTLKAARQAGLSVCSGGLFGLGETWEDRVDLAMTLRDEVGPDSVPLNFLNPIPGTPLENVKPTKPMDILRTVAIFRLAMPDTDIKVAGGREVNLRDLQSWIFAAGATSMMTGNYLASKGRGSRHDLQMIQDLGLEVVTD